MGVQQLFVFIILMILIGTGGSAAILWIIKPK
jgi:hypothetical protein